MDQLTENLAAFTFFLFLLAFSLVVTGISTNVPTLYNMGSYVFALIPVGCAFTGIVDLITRIKIRITLEG